METVSSNHKRDIEDEFVRIATALYSYFPDLDLRFNLRTGTTSALCLVPNEAKTKLTLPIGHKAADDVVRDAVWEIKELIRRFDD